MPSVQLQQQDEEDDVTESQRRHRDAVRPPSSTDPSDCAPLELPCLMPVSMEPQGTKHDDGKPRWDLLPMGPIERVVQALSFGGDLYGDDNWQLVATGPKGRRRYYAACLRHLVAWWRGERLDSKSGLPHLAHAVCCLLFLLWLDEEHKP